MIGKGYRNVLASQQASGTLFNTYTTSKTVINTDALFTLPANSLQLGSILTFDIVGAISNRVTGPDTTTFEIKFGSIVAFTSGAINLTTTAHTTIPFWAKIILTCQVLGATTTAKMMGQGLFRGQMFCSTSGADSAVTHGNILAPNTAPAQGNGFDSTASQLVDLWVAQSFSGAANGIQIHQYMVTLEN